MSIQDKPTATLLSGLLPEGKERGEKPLKEIRTITQLALSAFAQGELVKFDALVGENACQLRAAKILDLYEQFSHDPIMQVEINQVLRSLEIDPVLSSDLLFLVQSYLLTCSKKMKGGIEQTEPKELQKIAPGLSNSLVSSLVKRVQRQLATSSLLYLQNEAALLANLKQKELLQEMVQEEMIKKDKFFRPSAPCYFGLQILMQRCLEKKQLVLLKVMMGGEQMKILMRSNGRDYEISQKENPMEAAIVIEGVCKREEPLTKEELKKCLIKKGLIDLVLMNAAAHPQYAGENKNASVPTNGRKIAEYGLLALKERAVDEGCCLENPSLFQIDHIFCDTLKNQGLL